MKWEYMMNTNKINKIISKISYIASPSIFFLAKVPVEMVFKSTYRNHKPNKFPEGNMHNDVHYFF
jgi:hypothetical protein